MDRFNRHRTLNNDIVSDFRVLQKLMDSDDGASEAEKFLCENLEKKGVPFDRRDEDREIMATLGDISHGGCIAICANCCEISGFDISPSGGADKNRYRTGLCLQAAMALGAISILKRKKELAGTVKVLFQFDREAMFGRKPKDVSPADAVIGILPDSAGGEGRQSVKLGFLPGDFMPSVDFWEFVVKGKGGHAAYPQDCIDPVAVACDIVRSFQYLIDREKDPVVPASISVDDIHAESMAFNIIADWCRIRGATRTFSEEFRNYLETRIERIVKELADLSGAESEIRYSHGLPCLCNDTAMTMDLMSHAGDILGGERVVSVSRDYMTSTNFADYAWRKKGTCIKFFVPGLYLPGRMYEDELWCSSLFVAEAAARWLENRSPLHS